MLGFDALGRWALGQQPGGPTVTVVVVSTATFAITANAVTSRLAENISPAAYVVAPQGVTDEELQAVATASFAITAKPVTARFLDPVTTAAFVLTLNPTTDQEDEATVTPAAFTVTFNDVPLVWTGAGVDTSYYGGVGHYRYERERAKQLAAITRTIPPAIDRRTAPQFGPIARPYSAPIAPAIDLQAIQNQRMAQAAKAQRKRQDEEALMLLAS